MEGCENLLAGLLLGIVIGVVAGVIVGKVLRNKSLMDYRVNIIIGYINEMEAKGHEYWSNDTLYPDNKKLETEIKRLSSRVYIEIKNLNNDFNNYNFNNWTSLTRFRQAVTGGSFEALNKKADPNIVNKISSTCTLLTTECRHAAKFF